MKNTSRRFLNIAAGVLLSAALAACGGGGGSSSPSTPSSPSSPSGPSGPSTQAVSLVSPNPSAMNGLTSTGDFVADGLTFLNAFRQAAGVSVVTNNPQIATAAQNHANYEASVGLVTHDEPTAATASPDLRIQAVHPTGLDGEITGSTLVIQTQIAQESAMSITGLRDAPFHRENMFYCYSVAGVGSANGPAVFNAFYNSNIYTEYLNVDFADNCASKPADNQLVAWPFNGMTNVPNAWADTEAEAPAGGAVTNEHGATMGYPVTLQGYNNASFTSVSFTITDPNGFVIPCAEADTSNNANAKAAMALQCVPLLPLKANTVYSVTVTGSMANASFSATPFTLGSYSFTTGATNVIPDSEFIAPNLNTAPTQPINGLNAANTAVLQAQYACQQFELANPSATAPCSWLSNAAVAAGNINGSVTANAH